MLSWMIEIWTKNTYQVNVFATLYICNVQECLQGMKNNVRFAL